MIVIRGSGELSSITVAAIRELIEQRMLDMSDGSDFDPEINGFFIVSEPGDSLAGIEQVIGYPVDMHEIVEEHEDFFEAVYVPTDGDFGIVVLVPKQGIDPELLATLSKVAVPIGPPP